MESDKLKKIEETQNTILEAVTELKMAVCGSDKIGVEGLVSKVCKHDRYIETDKRQKWMIAGGVAVVTFIISIFLAIYKS
jgi:succinate dehydrogenase/fumarate reductase-like Fe-S protein